MENVKVLVLRAAGINCDVETAFAFELAGASAERIHINRLIERRELLNEFQILVFPGGFSYGDDVSAGRILANQVRHHLADAIKDFVAGGRLVLGICNGFQVLVKSGILPGASQEGAAALSPGCISITANDCGKFEDRWVYLEPGTQSCAFLEKDRRLYLPIAHGEGRFTAASDEVLEAIKRGGHPALRYVDADGNRGGFPVNPNGSQDDIAGLTDSTGRVLGLMPHPERYIFEYQHPRWTRGKENGGPDGMTVFRNGVEYIRRNL